MSNFEPFLAIKRMYVNRASSLNSGFMSMPIYLQGKSNLTFKKPYVIVNHTKAQQLYHSKIPISDGSIMEIVIWQLPYTTMERPHGLKYRLNYSLPHGKSLIRYDNELFKGDHKHINGTELPYIFKTIEELFTDFFRDITNNGGLLE